MLRSVIVTGAARGIGRAIAERFLKENSRVMITDVDEEAALQTQKELSQIGEVEVFVGSVAERIDVHNLVAETITAFGQIDVLVNNAGIIHAADFLEISEEDFDHVMSVNLKGTFLLGQAVAKHMVDRVQAGEKPGCIINISSINDTLAIPNQIPYTVSKGAVKQLTRAMAQALAPYDIRVNAIGPGSIKTELFDGVLGDREQMDKILGRTPLKRIGDASEVASVASFLASSSASYITGETIYVDGGRLSQNYPVKHDS